MNSLVQWLIFFLLRLLFLILLHIVLAMLEISLSFHVLFKIIEYFVLPQLKPKHVNA